MKIEIPSITTLATTTALTSVKKIHAHNKYINSPEFNKLTAKYFAARLAKTNLASKNDITDFIKETNFDDKLKNITSSKTKHVLVESELNGPSKKLKQYQEKDQQNI